MSSGLIFVILLAIAAFYVFLSVYLIIRLLSSD